MLIENFVHEQDAEDLINFFDNNEHLCNDSEEHHKDRNIHASAIKDDHIIKLLKYYAYKNIIFIDHIFKTKTKLWNEMRLCRWRPGDSMDLHIDRNTKTRNYNLDFSSLIYLNDNYEGGELVFENKELKMPRLSCIVFESHLHPHAVKEVKKNNRYTIPSWYQFKENKNENTTIR